MLHPTAQEIAPNGEFNRYEVALAAAKCARLITDEYVRQHDAAEKSITGNKETDKPLNSMIDKDIRDEKAVQLAVNRIGEGKYVITRDGENDAAQEAAPAEEAAEETSPDAEAVAETAQAEEAEA